MRKAIVLDGHHGWQRRGARQDVVHGHVVRGERVRVRAHGLDLGVVFVRRVLRRSAKHHVLEEVSKTGLAWFDFVAAASSNDGIVGDEPGRIVLDDENAQTVG